MRTGLLTVLWIWLAAGCGGSSDTGDTTTTASGTNTTPVVEEAKPEPQAPPVPAGAPHWVETFTGKGNAYPRGLAVNSSGAVAVTGEFEYSLENAKLRLDGGRQDAMIAVFESTGGLRWARKFGAHERDTAKDVAADGADFFVVGTIGSGQSDFGGVKLYPKGRYNSDVFVARYGEDGSLKWAKKFGDKSGDYGNAIAVHGSGDVLITGLANSPTDFGGGKMLQGGTYLVRLSPEGEFRSWHQFVGSGNAVAADGTGNTFFGGEYDETFKLAGETFEPTYGEHDPQPDAIIIGFDDKDNVVWAKAHGTPDLDRATDIAADHLEGAYVGGFVEDRGAGERRGFYARYSGDGKELWNHRIGGEGQSDIQGVARGKDGDLWVTGHFEGTVDVGGKSLTSAGKTDAFLARVSPTGEVRWAERYGSPAVESGTAVAISPDGGLYWTGYYTAPWKLGDVELASGGKTDIFVAHIATE